MLIAVCRALRFAHDRGVLHRDLKPANVMIGRFGEVYLLDWGIAVGLREDVGLPLASAQVRVAGSPAFMSPEMAWGDGPSLSVRSDVYLLGSNLFHVLSGRYLHDGATADAALQQARQGTRPKLGGVPAELRQLVERCTAVAPAPTRCAWRSRTSSATGPPGGSSIVPSSVSLA